MNCKELGQTGVPIPELGVGTWKYTGGVEPLRKAFELGAVSIDTAERYGTEPVVGRAIKGIRHRIFLASKVSPEHFRHSDVLKAADKSLQRLNTDYIDLYQLHWASDHVPIEETIGAMEDLVDAGKVRFVGVCNFSRPQLEKAQAATRKHKIVSNQVSYSLIDRNIEVELLPFCRTHGVSIIAYSPLANGLHNLLPRDPENVLARVAGLTHRTEAQIALNWCISKGSVVALFKASSEARVEENCKASGWRLTAEHVRMVEEGVRFQRRTRVELVLRRTAVRFLQVTGLR